MKPTETMKDNMKHPSRLFGLAMVAILALVACGGGGDAPEPEPTPTPSVRTFTADMSVSAEGGQIDRKITEFSKAISGTPQENVDWLSVTKKTYTSGSPEVTINVQANTATSSRSCVVTFVDVDGNKLLLTVLQAAGNGGTPDTPQVYYQSVSVPAQSGTLEVTLTSLKAEIQSLSNPGTWLSISWPAYISGSPKVKLTFSENTSTEARTADATFTATDNNKVILTVTQQGQGEDPINTGIDDRHDGEYTDQPAYSRLADK